MPVPVKDNLKIFTEISVQGKAIHPKIVPQLRRHYLKYVKMTTSTAVVDKDKSLLCLVSIKLTTEDI